MGLSRLIRPPASTETIFAIWESSERMVWLVIRISAPGPQHDDDAESSKTRLLTALRSVTIVDLDISDVNIDAEVLAGEVKRQR